MGKNFSDFILYLISNPDMAIGYKDILERFDICQMTAWRWLRKIYNSEYYYTSGIAINFGRGIGNNTTIIYRGKK